MYTVHFTFLLNVANVWIDYAVSYAARQPHEQILEFRRYGQVYPGSDGDPNPRIQRTCTVSFRMSDLVPYLSGERSFTAANATPLKSTTATKRDVDAMMKKLILIVGDAFNPESGQVTLKSDHFEEYGQNKKWLVDTLARLVEVSKV
jgi:hypothetical protein